MNTNRDRAMLAGTTLRRESFIERFAQRVGISAQSSMIFGEPIERNGVTMIPVARARWHATDGGAPGQQESQKHSEAGSWATVSPVGYVVLKDGKPRYLPNFNFAAILLWLIA